MADLVVTFCKTYVPGLTEAAVPRGRDVRTSALLIGASSVATADAARKDEYAILRAGAACWVQVAAAPVADQLSSSSTTQAVSQWQMAADEILSVACQAGDKVAVIQA